MTTRDSYSFAGLAAVVGLGLGLALAGCGDDVMPGADMATRADLAVPPDLTVLPDFADPPPPALGTQIDRMGRPAINAALANPLDLDKKHDATQDDYNKSGDPAMWRGKYGPLLAANLAIYDVLDGKCGNQALYDAAAGGASFANAGYARLGATLADDQLFLNTASLVCNQYLAVEFAAINGTALTDCGGRTPLYDVIDWTYGVLEGINMPFSDGVAKDEDHPASATTFPFLASPEQ